MSGWPARGDVGSRASFRIAGRSNAAAVVLLLAGAISAVMILRTVPTLPIGASYVDIVMYVDAAYRLALGERPHLDFTLPVNTLPFAVFALGRAVHPTAQPVLLAQYAYLLLLLPAMILVVGTSAMPRRALVASASLVAFALLPYNWGSSTFTEGGEIDGYGAYNRAAGLALFVLVSATFLRPTRIAGAIATAFVLPILWFTKLPAYVMGGCLVAMSVLADVPRGRRVTALVVAGLAAGPIVQLATGTLGAYLTSVLAFVDSGGGGTIVPRLRVEITDSPKLIGCFVAVGMVALLAVGTRSTGGAPRAGRWVQLPAVRYLASIPLAIAVESQNTGSQGYAFLLPAALAVVPAAPVRDWMRLAAVGAVAGCLVGTLGRPLLRARALARLPTERLDGIAGERFGASVARTPAAIARAMLAPPVAARTSTAGHVPDELEQGSAGPIVFMHVVGDGVRAFRAWHGKADRPARTVAAIDFVDPMPALLGLAPVRGMPIVFDPARNIPSRMHDALRARWRTADALLVRRCVEIDELTRIARPVLDERRVVPLGPCWDLYPARSR